MKVLLIGSGGRESAIAYGLKKSPLLSELYVIPGNPGISEFATFIDNIKVEETDKIVEFALSHDIDFTVVGPEVPLCLGLSDELIKAGKKVFGPVRASAMLEGSKAFSKDFMYRHHIPTARYYEYDNYDNAVNGLKDFDYPLVIKADGLAAGKGVVIAEDEKTAITTLDEMMNQGILKDAGSKVIIEEFLDGFECSLLCFTDGETIKPMVSVKDHKQIFDGNRGPNTGGMGSVSPNPFLGNDMDEVLMEDILKPFIKGLKEDHLDYRGCIFIGLMIKDGKAKVLEFNVRFGDPETQSIVLRLESDLLEIMYKTAIKELKDVEIKWNDKTAVCLVLASEGYPGSYQKGMEITGLDKLDDEIVIFHAGTKMDNGVLKTNGGRVLNVCALGDNLEDARDKVYAASEKIEFNGKYCRKDIGLN